MIIEDRLVAVLETVARAMEIHAQAQQTFATATQDLAQEVAAFRVGLRDQAAQIRAGHEEHLAVAVARRQEALDHAATTRAAIQELTNVRSD